MAKGVPVHWNVTLPSNISVAVAFFDLRFMVFWEMLEVLVIAFPCENRGAERNNSKHVCSELNSYFRLNVVLVSFLHLGIRSELTREPM